MHFYPMDSPTSEEYRINQALFFLNKVPKYLNRAYLLWNNNDQFRTQAIKKQTTGLNKICPQNVFFRLPYEAYLS